ncbi:Subtilisin-like protease, partial [Smittium culicis]
GPTYSGSINQIRAQAPLFTPSNTTIIPNHYIVVFKKNVKPDGERFYNHFKRVNNKIKQLSLEKDSNKVGHVYREGLVGYSGVFDQEIIDSIRYSNDVDYVENDQMASIQDTQSGAAWGLARISHREKLDSSTNDKYIYNPIAGNGVTVYILDTGIYTQHNDFGGRAVWGTSFVSGEENTDLNGHGTHVAGTVGSNTYGVAKRCRLVAVKIFGKSGNGPVSNVIAGIGYVSNQYKSNTAEAVIRGMAPPKFVANLSLSTSFSQALNSAVSALVSQGIPLVTSAGNSNANACANSPSSENSAITVGSIDVTDAQSYFSNYGKCVNLYAPGRSIKSTWIGSPDATNTISGTSMASPHVAGVAATIMSMYINEFTPNQIKQMLLATATKNKLSNLGPESPNILVYNSPPGN